MPDTKTYPKWKRALWLIFKVYCVLCTLLLTTFILLAIFENSSPKTSYGFTENDVLVQYGAYMAKEYPKRGDHWFNLAMMLNGYAQATNLSKRDVIKYLGNPDVMSEQITNSMALAYFYGASDNTNRVVVTASIEYGKLALIGFNSVRSNELSNYKP